MAILLAACAGSAVVPELTGEDPRKMTEESDEVISRGYEDIDPEDCWAAWCAIRDTLSPGGA